MSYGIAAKALKGVPIVRVRKAELLDVDAIIDIASSVGQAVKDPNQGFLVDNYQGKRSDVRKKVSKALEILPYFYVAELKGEPVGFLMAYSKEEWLNENPGWIEAISWHPAFNNAILDDFVLVDKTAIRAELTGQGIGSILYEALKKDLKRQDIRYLMAETVIHPVPNFASLNFRLKQDYHLAGTRYEFYNGEILTDLIYYKLLT